MFSSVRSLVPATKKESIFTKEGVFGSDVFNLRFWKLQRSTLLQKVFSAAVKIQRHFLRRHLIFQRQGKSRWIVVKEANSSQRLGKTSRFFRCLQKQIGVFQEKHPLWVFSSRCVEVVHRRLWSGSLNPSDDFSQLSFLKMLLSRTEAASRTLLPWEGPEDCYCDQILTIGVEKMLERRWRSSSSCRDVAAALLTF